MTALPLSSYEDDLARLSEALDSADVDLGELFEQLTVSVRASVASLCGLSITLERDGCLVTLTSLDHLGEGTLNAGAVTSLGIPLGAVTATATQRLELFATKPGAFVELALATDTEPGLVGLAAARVQPGPRGLVGVAGSSTVNQAIGALIERGFTPEQARAYLARNAAETGRHVSTSAADVLAAVIP